MIYLCNRLVAGMRAGVRGLLRIDARCAKVNQRLLICAIESPVYNGLYRIGWNLALQVIDSDGYRPNVGIILTNRDGQLLWARRVRQNAWQFPQGGIRRKETPEQAMFRELKEEIGLQPAHVSILGATRGWLRYRLPERYIRRHQKPVCIGQKQVWYMLRLVGEERFVRLDLTDSPEFDNWRWVDYWQPLQEVVPFKRTVYKKALNELAPLVFPKGGVPRSAVR